MKSDRPRLDMDLVRQGATLGAVGLEMGFSVVIGYAVGYYLDRWLGWSPVMTIIWTCLGAAAAAKAVVAAYQRAKKVGEDERPED
jgi:ATP synthase protein I